jgi:uncharacterized protein YkwD
VKTLLLCLTLSLWSAASQKIPSQRPGQPQIEISALEQRVHKLINQERTSRKLPALTFAAKLAQIARNHSEDMARRKFFGHVNPDGQDPTARGKDAGYTCLRPVSDSQFVIGLAENIFQGNLYSGVHTRGVEQSYDWNSADQIAEESVKAWMNSPGHRQNILDTHERAGIGISISMDDEVLITQVFC